MATRGKKIDTWEFVIDSVKIKVPVKMQSGDGDTTFHVELPEYELSLSDSDVNALREETRRELQQRLHLKWERFIYVQYCGHSSHTDWLGSDTTDDLDGTFNVESQMEYRIIEVATRQDGQQMHRYLNNSYNGGKAISGLPETGANEKDFHFHWKRSMSALIPFTPENMAALESIRHRFAELNRALEQRLAPENVQKTLETIARSGSLNLEYTPEISA